MRTPAKQPEGMTLRKDNGFCIYRAVFKAKNSVARHPVAAGELRYVTLCEGFAI